MGQIALTFWEFLKANPTASHVIFGAIAFSVGGWLLDQGFAFKILGIPFILGGYLWAVQSFPSLPAVVVNAVLVGLLGYCFWRLTAHAATQKKWSKKRRVIVTAVGILLVLACLGVLFKTTPVIGEILGPFGDIFQLGVQRGTSTLNP